MWNSSTRFGVKATASINDINTEKDGNLATSVFIFYFKFCLYYASAASVFSSTSLFFLLFT